MHDKGYAHPEVLVDTAWVAEHLRDPKVVLMESNEDPLLYEVGHIPGAVNLDWMEDLNHELRRDYLPRGDLKRLLQELGVEQDAKIVLYGDKNNWWATFAFWVLSLYGVQNLSVMDGGRQKWIEEGRELTKEIPYRERTDYTLPDGEGNPGIRAFRDDVLAHSQAGKPSGRAQSGEYWANCCHGRTTAGGRPAGGHIQGGQKRAVGQGGQRRRAPAAGRRTAGITKPNSALKSGRRVSRLPIGERSSFSGSCSPICWDTEKVRQLRRS